MLLEFQATAALRLCLENGGDDGVRTHDPLLAGQVLSQLSYTPVLRVCSFSMIIHSLAAASDP